MDDTDKGAEKSQAAAEWRANGAMVMAAMVGMSFFAMITYSFSQYIQPIEAETHWSRAAITAGLLVFNVTVALIGPFIGVLIDRHGARTVALPGSVLAMLGYAALGNTGATVRSWYLIWLAFALAAACVKSTVWSAAVSRAFTAGRGFALSVMLCGSAVAQFLAQVVTNALVVSHGWRTAFHWIGIGWGGLMVILVALFFHESHRRPSATPAPAQGGLTFAQALRSPVILRIAAVNLVSSAAGGGVTAQIMPLLTETGLDRTHAAGIAATAGIAGIFGKIVTGWLMDRKQGDIVPFTTFALSAIGYALLLNWLHAVPALLVGVLVLGYTAGAGLQVTTYLVSRYGGLKNFGIIFGTLASVLYVGSALGGFLSAAIHDATGSYQLLLLIAVPVSVLMGLLMVGLGPYPAFKAAE
ncbi:MAG: MFS transporter [Sphingomonadales bacterium]|nr:MFS transporter [Sphingomonadales bacterium]